MISVHGSLKMLALALPLLVTGLGTGCNRAAPVGGPAPSPAPAEQPAPAAPPPEASASDGRPARELALSLYAALSAGDPRPLAAHLDPAGTELLVDEGQPGREPYYAVTGDPRDTDWAPLLAWAQAHPAEAVAEVTAAPSPHSPDYVLVTLRLPDGYAYFLIRDGRTVSKLFLQPQPADWD